MLKNWKAILEDIFWPVEPGEGKQIFSFVLLMFCTVFNQTVLRILKDSVLVVHIGSEATNFAKLYLVTPFSAFLIIAYTYLVNKYSFLRIYIIFSISFCTIFALYAVLGYPNANAIHPSEEFSVSIMNKFPFIKWYVALLQNWIHVVFYVLAEVWPNVFFALLFWQLVNSLMNISKAKRLYSIIVFFGNIGQICGGLFMQYVKKIPMGIWIGSYCSSDALYVLITICLVIAFSIIAASIVRNIYSKEPDHKSLTIYKSKKKFGMLKSFKYIISSRYLWMILICTASFSLSMNLVEAVWKDQMKKAFSSVSSYGDFNGWVMTWTGIAMLFFAILGNNLMRRCKWIFSASITPMIVFVTGIAFFMYTLLKPNIAFLCVFNPLIAGVTMGAIQQVFAKSSKYGIWDIAKEILYIPLDPELKTKGKAAVDILSSKIGKSLSSLVQVVIFTCIPSATYGSVAWFLFFIFVIVCVLWMIAVVEVSKEYNKIEYK